MSLGTSLMAFSICCVMLTAEIVKLLFFLLLPRLHARLMHFDFGLRNWTWGAFYRRPAWILRAQIADSLHTLLSSSHKKPAGLPSTQKTLINSTFVHIGASCLKESERTWKNFIFHCRLTLGDDLGFWGKYFFKPHINQTLIHQSNVLEAHRGSGIDGTLQGSEGRTAGFLVSAATPWPHCWRWALRLLPGLGPSPHVQTEMKGPW